MADFAQMNFSQMHERLRLELLRRINRGTLSVSLLARQTGFGQSHISNFLHNRRQLSLEALDRILSSQQIAAGDLLPVANNRGDSVVVGEIESVPLVSHAAALFEPNIRPSWARSMLYLPTGFLGAVRSRTSGSRKMWQRFVAVSIAAAEALPMDPLLMADGIVLIDRHYNSLMAYRPNRQNLYVVRNGNQLVVRYLDFVLNRLVLRPHNHAYPVDLLEIPPGETPGDLIIGRIALILNEL